jgi:hypothetical protein
VKYVYEKETSGADTPTVLYNPFPSWGSAQHFNSVKEVTFLGLRSSREGHFIFVWFRIWKTNETINVLNATMSINESRFA